MAQVVEYLPSKLKALSSVPSSTKNKQTNKNKIKTQQQIHL
jgi:hypothetical protein